MKEYSTRLETRHGYRVLDPLPSRDELDTFFKRQYYDLIEQGKRAADIARTRRGGEEADDQARWFRETVHRDLGDLILEYAPGKHVIEVGCGMGSLVHDLAEAGLAPMGVDLAPESVSAVRDRGLNAIQGAFDTLVDNGEIEARSQDAVIFNNVLELTLDPMKNLRAAAVTLRPSGLLVVRGGNDFNPLQMAAVKALGVPEYWISPPEHINYLSFESVESMMREVAVEPLHRHGEFPMELWLLLGFNYFGNSALGAECHQRRVAMERALPVDLRRTLYRAFGQAGLGRTMVVTGRKA